LTKTSVRKERSLLYVYCAADGRVTAKELHPVPSLPKSGPPRVLALDDTISLVVADVPSDAYNSKALDAKMSDLDWIALCGAGHHAVSDALAKKHVVVPFRLFTLFSDESKALATLRRRRGTLATTLARLKGRAEWVLRIRKPEVAGTTAPKTARAVTSGADFLRAKAEQRIADLERAARIRHESLEVFEALKSIADQSATRPIDPATPLLLDAVFLIESRRTAAFKKALTSAAAGLLAEGCPVSLTGPWPPYSFVAAPGASANV
jgi:hypothetical protein